MCFSLPFLFFWSIWLEIYQFYESSVISSFCFIDFHRCFSVFSFIDFCFDFPFFPLLIFSFICSDFIKWKLRLLIYDFSSFLIKEYSPLNFPLSSSLLISHKYWYDVFLFSFTSNRLLISILISSLMCYYKCVINFQIARDFPDILLNWFLMKFHCGQKYILHDLNCFKLVWY